MSPSKELKFLMLLVSFNWNIKTKTASLFSTLGAHINDPPSYGSAAKFSLLAFSSKDLTGIGTATPCIKYRLNPCVPKLDKKVFPCHYLLYPPARTAAPVYLKCCQEDHIFIITHYGVRSFSTSIFCIQLVEGWYLDHHRIYIYLDVSLGD